MIYRFIVLLLVSSFSLSVQAQSRVERRAESRANQRVDQKVDQAVDRAFDRVEGLFKRRQNQGAENQDSTSATSPEADARESAGFLRGLSVSDEPWEPIRNDQPMAFVMDVVVSERNKEDSRMEMRYTFDAWDIGMEIRQEGQRTRMLLDNQGGYLTTIVQQDRQDPVGVRMRQRKVTVTDDGATNASASDEYTITKTGNTRVIDGYNCEEYRIESQEGVTNAWITQDLDLSMANLFGAFQAQNRAGKPQPGMNHYGIESGVAIESTTVSRNGRETTFIHLRDIQLGDNFDRSVFDTSGIQITELSY